MKTDKDRIKELRAKLRTQEYETKRYTLTAQERNDKYYEEIRETAKLKKKVDELEHTLKYESEDKKVFEEEMKNKNTVITQILRILIGEAEDISKYQVIRDIFLDDIKRIEESNKVFDNLPYQRTEKSGLTYMPTGSLQRAFRDERY